MVEILVLAIVLVSLSIYTIFGGADFGVGVWECALVHRLRPEDRSLMHKAIGPVWEANHVWLIFALVLLLTGFPPALAGASQALWVPLLLAATGIVFRGAAFAFRAYAVGAERQQQAWEAVFAVASVAAPFFLGAAAGAVASGRLDVRSDGTFHGNSASNWISPLAMYAGAFVVGMCAYASAVLLTWEAARGDNSMLADRWRKRSLAAGLLVGAMASGGLYVAWTSAEMFWQGLSGRAAPLVALSAAGGFLSLLAMWRRRFMLATIGVCLAELSVVVGWGVAQYPYLVPPQLTISDAAAPANVLGILILCALVGMTLLAPALIYLLVTFKSAVHAANSKRN